MTPSHAARLVSGRGARARWALGAASLLSACGGVERAPAPPAREPEEVDPPLVAQVLEVPASPPASAAPEAPPPDTRPRLHSVGFATKIWPKPSKKGQFLGYVRFGGSVVLKSSEPVVGEGCPKGYLAVEPRGYVCRDHTVNTAPSPELREALASLAPRPGPFPFEWAISNQAPMYNRLPTAAEAKRAERGLGPPGVWQKLHRSHAAHEELALSDVIVTKGAAPTFLEAGRPVTEERLGLVRQTIPLGSMLSYTRAFALDGRPYYLSTDLTVVPADRARRFRPSSFAGVALSSETTLPGAFARREARALYAKASDGSFSKVAELDKQGFVSLTGAREARAGRVFLETKRRAGEPPRALFVDEREVTVVESYGKLPFSVKATDKWIQARISAGTLVAYEGLKPVFATLMSPGKGGVPVKGRDPVQDATTPTGTWRVTFKDRASHMSPDTDPLQRTFWIADVPWILYFAPPFAVHGAFWHERFGEPTSAGCINVSPRDGQWLFEWSDPVVPEGWGGATGAGAPENGPTTVVVVQR